MYFLRNCPNMPFLKGGHKNVNFFYKFIAKATTLWHSTLFDYSHSYFKVANCFTPLTLFLHCFTLLGVNLHPITFSTTAKFFWCLQKCTVTRHMRYHQQFEDKTKNIHAMFYNSWLIMSKAARLEFLITHTHWDPQQ